MAASFSQGGQAKWLMVGVRQSDPQWQVILGRYLQELPGRAWRPWSKQVRATTHPCHPRRPPGSQELALADRVLQSHSRELPHCHVEGSKREAGRGRCWGGDASAGDREDK